MKISPVDQGGRKLILGTAQFGMPYGATNVTGQVTPQEAVKILAVAVEAGIDSIDTAAGYGVSETVLGTLLPAFPLLRVITKLPGIGGAVISADDIRSARETISKSLEHLHRDTLDGLLLHQGEDIFKPGGEQVIELLQSLRETGVAARIGVSVYDASDIDRILKVFKPDIVQVPLNLFDQRLIGSGHIRRMTEAGIEVHARSAFLQGILLADAAALPVYFRRFDEPFERYRNFLLRNELTRMQACLGFVTQLSGMDRIVVGVTRASELTEILASIDSAVDLSSMSELSCEDPMLIDPRRWTVSPVSQVLTP